MRMTPARIIRIAALVVVAVCAWLIVLTIYGYGHVVLHTPNNATLTINGHAITQDSLKLRPGSYTIIITSPRYFTVHDTFRVSAFRTTQYSPVLQQRTGEALVQSITGQSMTASHLSWFQDYTWAAGITGKGSAVVFAAHYVNNRWVSVYQTGDGNTSSLPQAVAQQVESLEDFLHANT